MSSISYHSYLIVVPVFFLVFMPVALPDMSIGGLVSLPPPLPSFCSFPFFCFFFYPFLLFPCSSLFSLEVVTLKFS